MSLKIVIDMNLSPEWVMVLANDGWQAVHWSSIGQIDAADSTIMSWALTNSHVVFTHDLDFGTTLALTKATGPSVIQVRGLNVMPEHLGSLVCAALRQYEQDLTKGAIVVVDEKKLRARVLPL